MDVETNNIYGKNMWSVQNYINYVDQLFLMDSPKTILTIWILYMIFIYKIGPNLMKNRPAFELTEVLTIYNVGQVGASAYLMYKGIPMLWKEGLMPKCLYHRDDAMGHVSIFQFYIILKIIELLDTVFFILRKKYNQATFLHVYHHSYMVLSVWITAKYDPSYVSLFPIVLNSTVHLVMYMYYGLAAFPQLTKYLWWKKYITTVQLIQFLVITVHMLRGYHTTECPPSFILAYSMVGNMFLFLSLFTNFYIKSYGKPK